MQGRLTIFVTVVLVLLLFVALNAASYVQIEQQRDSEFAPDRSTANAGETGTRALYEYLQEAGFRVVRWRTSTAELLMKERARPRVFVVIGDLRRHFEREEAEALRRWVREEGGRLVIIDRMPDTQLLPPSGEWRVSSEILDFPNLTTRPGDVAAMTSGVPRIAPVQPTIFTRDVREVVRSRFASRLHIFPLEKKSAAPAAKDESTKGVGKPFEEDEEETDYDAAEDEARTASPSPVVHLPDGREGRGALLIDYLYGRGRIVVLSDPFIVSNIGLPLGDNLQLAVNLVAPSDAGAIAFDEYHQGRGSTGNFVLNYFAGTPALPLALQLGLLLLAVIWTRSQRFARPLPAPRLDRRSNLEFVASMGELQQRARAYDLALENIYGRTRRALARYTGLPANAHHTEIAARVAMRAGRDRAELEALLAECEETIAGARISARRTLQLVGRLRELEHQLGIRMRAREIRQAKAL